MDLWKLSQSDLENFMVSHSIAHYSTYHNNWIVKFEGFQQKINKSLVKERKWNSVGNENILFAEDTTCEIVLLIFMGKGYAL